MMYDPKKHSYDATLRIENNFTEFFGIGVERGNNAG